MEIVNPNRNTPTKMRTEKLSMNTLICGMVFANTIKSKLTTMPTAITGAAMRTATTKVCAHMAVTALKSGPEICPPPIGSTP